jgi:hypothetical protein
VGVTVDDDDDDVDDEVGEIETVLDGLLLLIVEDGSQVQLQSQSHIMPFILDPGSASP